MGWAQLFSFIVSDPITWYQLQGKNEARTTSLLAQDTNPVDKFSELNTKKTVFKFYLCFQQRQK